MLILPAHTAGHKRSDSGFNRDSVPALPCLMFKRSALLLSGLNRYQDSNPIPKPAPRRIPTLGVWDFRRACGKLKVRRSPPKITAGSKSLILDDLPSTPPASAEARRRLTKPAEKPAEARRTDFFGGLRT